MLLRTNADAKLSCIIDFDVTLLGPRQFIIEAVLTVKLLWLCPYDLHQLGLSEPAAPLSPASTPFLLFCLYRIFNDSIHVNSFRVC